MINRKTILCGFLAAGIFAIILAGSVGAQRTVEQDVELKAAIAKTGYKVTKSASSTVLADWELRWKIVSKRTYSIVGKQALENVRCGPMPSGGISFSARRICISPRFFVDVEDFASEADAQKRIDHIVATPPGADSKMIAPEYDLREGFRVGTKVYVVGTEVYTLVKDGSLTAFCKKLQGLVEEARPDPKRST